MKDIWTYKGCKFKRNRGKKYITYGPDGKRWLGSKNWSNTLRRISMFITKESKK